MVVDVQKEYSQYRWIANEFAAIKGVESVALDHTEDGMNLLVKGADRSFEFPLRRLFFTDFVGVEDIQNPYDVLELDDPAAMVKLGKAKANMFINDLKVEEEE